MAVILEIEDELNSRSQLLERVRSDVQRHEQLRQLNEAQGEAVTQMIRVELVKGRWSSILINGVITLMVAIAIFVAGFFAVWI